MTHKFVDHSVIVHPLSSTTEQSFNKLGATQTTIYNMRMVQLVEMAPVSDIKISFTDKHYYQRASLYKEAEMSYQKGLYLLRANNLHPTVRFEGSVIIDQIEIYESGDRMTTLSIDELGHFSLSDSIKSDTIDLLKNLARHQNKFGTSFKQKDSNTVVSDSCVRFEMVRSAASSSFLLRIRNLK